MFPRKQVCVWKLPARGTKCKYFSFCFLLVECASKSIVHSKVKTMVLPGSEQTLGQFVNICEMQYEMH